jgi:ferredoxin
MTDAGSEEKKIIAMRYFTGTGNSLRVAQVMASVFGASGYETDLRPIAERRGLKSDEADSGIPDSTNFAAFYFPVYALSLPRIAKKYLGDIAPRKSPARALLVVTAGDANDAGWSLLEGRELLEAKGFSLDYADLVHMPNNWITFIDSQPPEEAERILREGEEKAEGIARDFLRGESYAKEFNIDKFGPIASRLLRFGFGRIGVNRMWRKFGATEACTGCGTCEKICPTRSICLEGGKPKWTNTCEQCMRCVNFCPARAIVQLDAILKGSARRRYREPHFKPASQ